MRDQLKDHIKAVLDGIQHLSVDDAADLIAEISDEIAEDRTTDVFNGAIRDGTGWIDPDDEWDWPDRDESEKGE